MRHLIGIHKLTHKDILDILHLAALLKKQNRDGIPHPLLQGKTVAMIFSKPSTRTRVSFETGVFQLGGYPVCLQGSEIQLGRGESVADTARVLSRYVDIIVIRTGSHEDVEEMARHSSIPVINALTDLLHPCQVLSDLFTIREEFGVLKGLKLAYVGDGNNVANSLLFGCGKTGMHISLATPAGYRCPGHIVALAEEFARESGGSVTQSINPQTAVKDASVVYTDTWVSMGMESDKEERIRVFQGYRVDTAMMSLAKSNGIFLHCLPAYRGMEVSEEIIDGPRSRVFDQAENRLHVQKAILVWLTGGI